MRAMRGQLLLQRRAAGFIVKKERLAGEQTLLLV
jgi:hypothetical protein